MLLSSNAMGKPFGRWTAACEPRAATGTDTILGGEAVPVGIEGPPSRGLAVQVDSGQATGIVVRIPVGSELPWTVPTFRDPPSVVTGQRGGVEGIRSGRRGDRREVPVGVVALGRGDPSEDRPHRAMQTLIRAAGHG